MTSQAVSVQDVRVLLGDDDGLGEILQRECLGVVPAILCLGDVLLRKAWRQMAIRAGRHGVVTRLLPRVILGLHDVAVGARLRVGAQVGQALGIVEGRAPNAEQHPKGRERDRWQDGQLQSVSPGSRATRYATEAVGVLLRGRGCQ